MNEQVPMMSKQMMNPPLPTAAMMKPLPQMMNPQPSQAPAPPPQVTVGSLFVNKRISDYAPYQMSGQKPNGYLNSTGAGGFGCSQMIMNPQQQMMNRGYGMWGHPPQLPTQPMDLQLKYQNLNAMKAQGVGGGYGKPPSKHQLGPRNNWKGKKVSKVDKRNDLGRRMGNPMPMAGWNRGGGGGIAAGPGAGVGGFNPPSLNELQYQNRVKTRRYFQKNYHNNNGNKNNNNRGKFAPRNTSSFIMRSKKSGGIAELVSPCPVTPAVLPTPVFSPSREVLVDMAKEEWGVDGYGSMNGLIRLRSPGNDGGEEDEDDEGSSGSDVEEHVEVERRLDHDLSRFEMIYPNYGTIGVEYNNNVLGNRVDDQDSHIAQLEDENLILKERLFLMEREMSDLRRRLQYLERSHGGGDLANEEVVENLSENESDSRSGAHSMEDNNEELGEENVGVNLGPKGKEEDNTLDTDDNGIKLESGISFDKEEQGETEGTFVELEDKINIVGVQVDTAVGQVQEEKKDEVTVNDVEQNAQLNTDGSNNVEAPENTNAGKDVSMNDVAPNEGVIEEN